MNDLGRTAMVHPRSTHEAEEIQRRLRERVITEGEPQPVRVAGLDVAYDVDSDRVVGAVVVLDAHTLDVLDQATTHARAAFDYVPGLLAFREAPALLAALERLTVAPDLLVCDGYGLAHPRRFGLACHLGVLTDLPAIGVAKTPFTSSFTPPGPERGARSDLVADGDVLGRVLRTRSGVKPVFVSVGHRIGLDAACRIVLGLCRDVRLPETTRAADRLCRQELARTRTLPKL
jgi:deoxyribonuclease V